MHSPIDPNAPASRISIRESFAVQILAGLLSAPCPSKEFSEVGAVKAAIGFADALIDALGDAPEAKEERPKPYAAWELARLIDNEFSEPRMIKGFVLRHVSLLTLAIALREAPEWFIVGDNIIDGEGGAAIELSDAGRDAVESETRAQS